MIQSALTTFADGLDLEGLSTGIQSKAGEAVEAISEPVSQIHDALSYAVPDGSGLANGMVDGIIQVLQDRVAEACEQIIAFCSAISAAAMSALGIHSPSKVFYGIGSRVVEGFNDAIDDGKTDSKDAIRGLADFTADEMRHLVKLLNNYSGEINFNGYTFTKSDLPRIYKRLDALEKKRSKRRNKQKSYEPSSSGGGGGGVASGVQEFAEAAKEASDEIQYGGVKMGIKELTKLFKMLDGKDKVNFLGQTFTKDDVAALKKKAKDAGMEVVDNLISPIVEGIKGPKSSLPTPPERGIKGTTKNNIRGILKERKQGAEEPETKPNQTTTYNLTQNISSPKPLSRTEVYRQTKNLFQLMKTPHAKVYNMTQ